MLSEFNLHTVVRLPKGVFAPCTSINTNILFFEKTGKPTSEVWFYEHPYPDGYKSYSKTKPMRIEEFEPEKAWWGKRTETEQAWCVSFDQIKERGFDLDIKNPNAPVAGHEDPDALLERYKHEKAAVAEIREELRRVLSEALEESLKDAEDVESVRTAWSRICQNMDELFTDPADVEPLRKAILQLAVRGRLERQNRNNESAEALIRRLQEEKKQLHLAGMIKRPKEYPAIDYSDCPFGLPVGWSWSRIDEIAHGITDGVHKTPTYVSDGTPFLSIKDISGGAIDFSNTRFVTRDAHEEMIKRCHPTRGDILFCRIGTLGRAIIVDTSREFSLFVSVGLIKLGDMINPKYLAIALNSPFAYAQYERIKAGGSHTNKLNLGAMRAAIVPIPPLEEQSRIVSRVDLMLDLCERLEKRLVEVATKHAKLTVACVQGIAGP